MKFPRPTIKIGKCIAVVQTSTVRYPERVGLPLLIDTYPIIQCQDGTWRGHRLSYSLNVKKITRKCLSKNGFILHTCDKKWCINPGHLYKGSQKDNSRDTFERHPTVHQNMSNSHVGLKHKKKTLQKMSKSQLAISELKSKKMIGNQHLLGFKFSKESRSLMSKSQLERFAREKASRP